VNVPEDARFADIQDAGIAYVSRRHGSRFTHLKKLILSGNSLAMNAVSCFPALEILGLKCNGIREVAFGEKDFPYLQVLDLSYNRLSQPALRLIGNLPSLVELDLSGNELETLPAFGDRQVFPKLKILNASFNRLSTETAFQTLSLLPQLEQLDLSSNGLSVISNSVNKFGGFPSLVILNLSNNLIAKVNQLCEVCVMSDVCWLTGGARCRCS